MGWKYTHQWIIGIIRRLRDQQYRACRIILQIRICSSMLFQFAPLVTLQYMRGTRDVFERVVFKDTEAHRKYQDAVAGKISLC